MVLFKKKHIFPMNCSLQVILLNLVLTRWTFENESGHISRNMHSGTKWTGINFFQIKMNKLRFDGCQHCQHVDSLVCFFRLILKKVVPFGCIFLELWLLSFWTISKYENNIRFSKNQEKAKYLNNLPKKNCSNFLRYNSM